MSYHLINTLQGLGHPRILVLGDLILDRYVWGDAERVSQEAPVILLREDRQEERLGGAANVAHMLRGLEAHVTLAGVVGADADGERTCRLLESLGVETTAVLADSSRQTTVKERFLGRAQHRHPHQMLRVDRESRLPLDAGTTAQLLETMLPMIEDHQAVLISDYAKGVCTAEILSGVIQAARQHGVPVIVDPSSGHDYRNYRGATALTPNRSETQRATGRKLLVPADAFDAGRQFCTELELDHIFLTLDSDGIVLVHANGTAQHLPTRRREVYDITGAGDMVLATIGLGSAARVAPDDLARLANVAGGLEVEQIGVVTISRDQILSDLLAEGRRTHEKICTLKELRRHVEVRHKLGHRIVLTNGCFDVLHIGHVHYLQQAADEGDCLIVAVNSDAGVQQLDKGPDRPVFNQEHRAAMLAALEAVDYVTVFEEATPHRLIEWLRPDLLVKGGTYRDEEIVGRELVAAYGGAVKALGAIPGISTTEILQMLRGESAGVVTPHPGQRTERKAG